MLLRLINEVDWHRNLMLVYRAPIEPVTRVPLPGMITKIT